MNLHDKLEGLAVFGLMLFIFSIVISALIVQFSAALGLITLLSMMFSGDLIIFYAFHQLDKHGFICCNQSGKSS